MKQHVAARPMQWREDISLNELDRRTLGELEALYGPRRKPAPPAPVARPAQVATPKKRGRSRLRAIGLIAVLVAVGLMVIDSPYGPVLSAWIDRLLDELARASSPITATVQRLFGGAAQR